MDSENPPFFLPSLAQRFQTLVWSCIDSDLTRSAVFHAERYFALNQRSHDARHLYATALLYEGQTYSALCLVNLPRDQQCSGCLEIKAKCCKALGRFRQAHDALEEAMAGPPPSPSVSRIALAFPEEAVLHSRAGTMAMKGNLHSKASSHFRQALALNPFMWEAFEALCSLGAVPDIDELFPPRPTPIKRATTDESMLKSGMHGTGTSDHTRRRNLAHSRGPLPRDVGEVRQRTAETNAHPTHRTSKSQPSMPAPPQPHSTRPLSSADEAGPVQKKMRSGNSRYIEPSKSIKISRPEEETGRSRVTSVISKGNSAVTTGGANARRSTRLLSGTGVKQPHNTKPSIRDRRRQPIGRSRSNETDFDDDTYELTHSPSPPHIAQSPSSDAPAPWGHWTVADDTAAQEAYEADLSEYYIYDVVRRFARATHFLATYDSQKCLDELGELPNLHQQTPWVVGMVGRAHFEKADYAAADRAFKALRVLEPFRLWDMEVYSTLLWHLQRSVELSFLAQELMNIDPRSPQAWIAVGNLFSLQKERSQALTCFRRAVQMEPGCAYAYTLSGHELIDEDLEKAIGFFQSALRVDSRHYNAWYGLGTCYLRLSKLRLAEYHYRKALEIHPNNAVLLGCVGMAVERRGDQDAALVLFDEAVRMSPDNALVRYRRAKIYISMKQYNDAIKDLEYLYSSSPDEANVVFQLAKAYRLAGDEVNFAKSLASVRDIAPKSQNKIRKLLETVKDGGEDRMDEG